jgi:hypothetical protein
VSPERTTLFEQKPPGPPSPFTEFLAVLAIALGCAGGVVAFLDFPPIMYFWPLGLGLASLVLVVAAWLLPGSTPPSAFLGVVVAVLALIAGISQYSNYQDAIDQTQNALDAF